MKRKRRFWAVFFAACTALAVLWLPRLSAPGIERTSDSDIHADQLRADNRTASDRALSPPLKENKSGVPFAADNAVENPAENRARPNGDVAGQVSEQESEQAYIERLRRLAVEQPDSALALAEQGEESFPNGEFSEERQAIAINALVRLDRIGEARSRTRAFIRRYPKGRFTRQVRGLTGVHPRPAGPNREWEW